MRLLSELFDNNRKWAANEIADDRYFFSNLADQQTPQFLWIGCSDSRVPPNQVIGLEPGELFVHRNIGNVVAHTDLNCLSVVEFAVAVLKVQHIIVCGHYGCGGVSAASQGRQLGLIDNWVRHIRDVRHKHEAALRALASADERLDRLCELNVVEQVHHVCHTSVVQAAWERGRSLAVHGWIHRLQDGLLQDLEVSISSPDEIAAAYRVATDPGLRLV